MSKNQLTPAAFAIASGLAIGNADWSRYSAADILAFVLFMVAMIWLAWPSGSSGDASAHQSVNEGLAFRFGKALNGIFRRFNRTA